MSVDVNQLETAKICPECQGSGWRTVGVGIKQGVARCECQLRARAERLLQNAGIPPRYKTCTLENYRTDPCFQNLAHAKAKAQSFVEQYPIDKTGLIFVGRAGAGKTHLAIGIIRELILTKGIACYFCGFQELLEKIKNSYDPSVQMTSLEILRPVFESEVVVLDDLGAVIPSGWVKDTISFILNKRYEGERTTVLTTNFHDGPPAASDTDTPDGRARRVNREQTLGDRIGERMRDRVHEMCRMISLWEVPSFRGRSLGSDPLR
ncbi:MAG: ATP-binding protein [Acidobacteria bacterium]|nr:ATP-binding protein [Acidobacteriota bacterium]